MYYNTAYDDLLNVISYLWMLRQDLGCPVPYSDSLTRALYNWEIRAYSLDAPL